MLHAAPPSPLHGEPDHGGTTRTRAPWVRWTIGALTGLTITACSAHDQRPDTIAVFAASSLTEAFTDIGERFSLAHPEYVVDFNFAASSELARQIREGAPADVFASADTDTMDRLTADGAIADAPIVFTRNAAEIAVAPGNPLGLTGLGDLADQRIVLVVCAPEVPCGSYAEAVFDRADVDPTPESFEPNVKSVVTKVAVGEADAGIVYRTDIVAADEVVDGLAIPPDANIAAEYPIARLADAPDPTGAALFIEFVLGASGQTALTERGFTAP